MSPSGITPERNQRKNSMEKIVIEMTRGKECVGSVRFEVPKALADKVAATNVYISRKAAALVNAGRVRVTIEALN